MSKFSIPFNKPFIAGKELYYIAQAVLSSHQLSGDGYFGRKCQKWLEENTACPKVLLTHSCTAALEMAAILCDIEQGDEIIMPSFTFVSTANAFVLRGGVPVFVDIRPDTLNIDENLIEAAVTDKTRAIVPVHYAGNACAMEKIMGLAEKFGLYVIEDAAQALCSTYRNRSLGTIGHLGTFSFHETKNVISGEGGALLINDQQFIERAEIIWEKGTNRRQFHRGAVDKYTWIDIGSSYLPSEVVSAFLFAQLEISSRIVEKRRTLYDTYSRLLQPLEKKGKIILPRAVEEGASNAHIFYILTGSATERSRLIEKLRDEGILSVFHYIPLHSSPAGKQFGRTSGSLKNTDDLSSRLLRLPLYYEMKNEQVDSVADAILAFYSN